jgi:hypothetical protein
MAGKSQKLFIQLWILLFFVVSPSISLKAQQKDSTDIYRKIKKYAYKRKFTKFLYEGVFRDPPAPVPPSLSNKKSLSNQQKQIDPNAAFVGKTIRQIIVQVYDPFGHSVNDTLVHEISSLQKLGNRAHITTRTIIIRNLLLFKKNQKVDILKITESERIIRQAIYVNDARIYLSAAGHDSVDVKVIVQDRWSWDVEAEITSPTDGNVTFRDRNLGGLGQQFNQTVYHDFSDKQSEYQGHYNINNIGNTYLSSMLSYSTKKNYQQVGLAINRFFFSPLTKWAGGATGFKTWDRYKYLEDSVAKSVPLEYFSSDYWIGRSFNPRKGNSIDKKSRNISVAIRYTGTHYQKRPSFELDTNRINLHSSLYIGSVGYSVRKYYKDKYIYRFGANEDVPEGWLAQILYGILDKEQNKLRYYTGFELSWGKHYDRLGYIGGALAYGNYFNKGVRDDAAINAGLTYFSDLIKIGRWYIRQFAYYRFVYGINKTKLQTISFSRGEMYGLNSALLKGTRKMVLDLETVIYTPYSLIGFRFAPVVLIGIGMVDKEQPKFFNTRVYQSYAAGVLIRNENLLVSSFQFTVGVYPYTVPGNNTHFKVNPIASFSLKVSGFAASKPNPIMYQ